MNLLAKKSEIFTHIPLVGNSISMRLTDTSDADFILEMRLDSKKSRYISKVENDLEKQILWLREYKKRESECQEFYFIIQSLKDAKRLGLVRIYDFKGDSFCWGSWIIKDSAPKIAAIESAMLIYVFAFEILGFKNSHFDVRNDNISVINFHKRLFNAQITHIDNLSTYFTFSYNDFLESKKKYAMFLPKVTKDSN